MFENPTKRIDWEEDCRIVRLAPQDQQFLADYRLRIPGRQGLPGILPGRSGGRSQKSMAGCCWRRRNVPHQTRI